jgi:gamma-glutamylputrescine oxidase
VEKRDRSAGGQPYCSSSSGWLADDRKGDVYGPYWLSQVNPDTLPAVSSVPAEAEVVVIGGGVIGVAITYWLAKFGARVLLLESRQLAWGASGRSAGLMLGGQSSLEDLNLVRTVLKDERIHAEYEEPGHLALASSPDVLDKMWQEVTERTPKATPLYLLDRKECEELLQMRISGQFLGGRWLPQAATIHPARFIYGLATAAIRHGAAIAPNTPALHVDSKSNVDSVDVKTVRGQIRSRHVIIACNAKTGLILHQLGKVITPVRGQVLSTYPMRPAFRIGLGVDWGTVYWRQTMDGVIVLGGYRNRDPVSETSTHEALNPKIQSALSHFLPEAFPGFPRFTITRRWAGIMDYTADGKPIVGRWPGRSNVWIASGFGGHGFPPALGVGKALAEAVVYARHPTEIDPFDPARLNLKKEVLQC